MMNSTHLPVKLPLQEICKEPRDVIAVDVVGLHKAAMDWSQYILTVQDLASGLVLAIPLKTKGEAKNQLICWIGQFFNLSQWPVKHVWTNNAFKFATSSSFAKFVTRLGIVHEKSVPYEHHQNGAVERTNWTITKMCLALIHTRGLPPNLWLLEIHHAVYIFNCLVHAGRSATPMEIAWGICPLLAMLRVFGCVAYAIYQHNHLKQVVPYAGQYRHVGISFNSNSWLLWCKDTGKIITAVAVRFEESPTLPLVSALDANWMESDPQTEAMILAIETGALGDFWLGNALDTQDAMVDMLERRDPYGADSPSYKEAVGSEQAEAWREAMLEDLCVHVKTDPPTDKKKLLRLQWLISTKRDMTGNILWRKAWIIFGGHKPLHGVNYSDTFAPTPTFASLCTALKIVPHKGWSTASFNVKTVFLHSKIDDDVWVLPPPGCYVLPGKVWKLKKALYGTKKAGRCWWLHLKVALELVGFSARAKDQSTYVFVSLGLYGGSRTQG
jgi:hypothetical protein